MTEAILVAIIAGGFGVLVALVTGLFAWLNGRGVKKDVRDVKDQVKNSHATNLRDDFDVMLSGLASLLEGQERHEKALESQGEDLRALRKDMAQERAERLAGDQDLRVALRANV